ncbi:class I SAM-dependent methyltransferase [Vibrio sp. ABG19]|uniref:class I SAM-dependent methyltransferase n=1 Tax=Vibrio sp. ABG19 TaxID=2817385 RepID=UPI00249DB15D|nr:class I SAM-dependent methyltransferase [Vibrio sp. ABG19]WGY46619.1 class I SAM-dependent methyltransferase [Vibrio sp. ABG19]
MSATTSFYDENATHLAQQYNSLAFESVHQSWSQYWPKSGAAVLDVGAGSGRDARWMSERGCSVVAVEPSIRLRDLVQQSCSEDVTCLDDSLPYLSHVVGLAKRYDLVMLSAVWMHIPIEQRSIAIKVLSNLLVDDGILVITLRHGGFRDGRETFGVSVSELDKLAGDFGLVCCHVEDEKDFLNREEVMWQTVVMKKTLGLEG